MREKLGYSGAIVGVMAAVRERVDHDGSQKDGGRGRT